MNVYFISGIAADKRIFRNIRLQEGYKAIHLEWIKPENDESLDSYADRLSAGIDTSRPFLLVGLSFGGMLAVEIARKYPQARLILISSIPCNRHLPWYFKVASKIKLHKYIPISVLKSLSLLKRFFTAETPEEKKYLRSAIRESDVHFIRWALNAIVTWQRPETPGSYIHIHGTRDEVLPIRYTSPSHVIKGGGHLMVLSRSGEINRILQEVCARN